MRRLAPRRSNPFRTSPPLAESHHDGGGVGRPGAAGQGLGAEVHLVQDRVEPADRRQGEPRAGGGGLDQAEQDRDALPGRRGGEPGVDLAGGGVLRGGSRFNTGGDFRHGGTLGVGGRRRARGL